MREITLNQNDGGQRLDKFLSKTLCKMPQSMLYKSIRKGRVRVNGKKVTDGKLMLSVGDTLSLYINNEFFETEHTKFDFLTAPANIDVVYEDQNILLANKAPALAVHDFEGSSTDTLINRIIHYLYNKKEYDPESENSFEPALCNRIDRNTCGIVIAAKNAAALREMNEMIKAHKVEKKYLALCHGAPKKESGELKFYLKKLSDKNIVEVSERPLPDHKTAITLYKVLKKTPEFSLLELTLKTGRTHQIRASLAHIGCAILGDGKYGKSHALDSKLGFPYQALCSYFVKFNFEDAETLNYLNGKSFSVSDIWFKDKI
ncbi:MAG: RluA family pseudouridine synthase [Oscillospiraceae bacterium]|nr:RluA family pseudouridine synthase [Oscillospiraceae bacterium]